MCGCRVWVEAFFCSRNSRMAFRFTFFVGVFERAVEDAYAKVAEAGRRSVGLCVGVGVYHTR